MSDLDKPTVDKGKAKSKDADPDQRPLPQYFQVLNLHLNPLVVAQVRILRKTLGDQVEISHEYVPAKHMLSLAENLAAKVAKRKQLEDEIDKITAGKGKEKDRASKIEKINPQLEKVKTEIERLLTVPAFKDVSTDILVTLAAANLDEARKKMRVVEKKRTDLRDKEENCDNIIADAVKKSYKQLSLKLHPDRMPHSTEADKVKFQELREAHTVLSEMERRKEYIRIYDHAEYLRLRRPKTADELAPETGKAAGKGKAGSKASAKQAAQQGGALRLQGGIPHQCSIPRITMQTVVNKKDATTRIAVLWTCSEAEFLGVTKYEIELTGTPLKGDGTSVKHVSTTTLTYHTVEHLSAGEWALRTRGCNHIGLGPWSMPLHLFIEDPTAARDAAKRAAEMERYVKRRKATDVLEIILRVAADEGIRGRPGRIDERIQEIRESVDKAKSVGVDKELVARGLQWLDMLGDHRTEKTQMNFWKDKLTAWYRITLLEITVVSNGQLALDFAEGIVGLPKAQEIHATVKNMLVQHVVRIIEGCPRLIIMVPGESKLTAEEVASLGLTPGQRKSGQQHLTQTDADLNSGALIPVEILALIKDHPFAELLPRWRIIHPHDRVRCVVAASLNRQDLFAKERDKLLKTCAKMDTDRARLEQEWRTITSKRKAAQAKQQAEMDAHLAAAKDAKMREYSVIQNMDGDFDFGKEKELFAQVHGAAAGSTRASITALANSDRTLPTQQPASTAAPPGLRFSPAVAAMHVPGQAPAVPASSSPAGSRATVASARPSTAPMMSKPIASAPTIALASSSSSLNRVIEPKDVRRVILCKYYQQGKCWKGNKCTFGHLTDTIDPGIEIGVWQGTKKCRKSEDGSCSVGSECLHSDGHVWVKKDPPASKKSQQQQQKKLEPGRTPVAVPLPPPSPRSQPVSSPATA
ncbi:hypothetical protein M427DRAFT_133476 [Gonapodya prolifera JEL478]|uniref:C3H1-type domain-containing protein n=1 Tax=Gonapodya prolifera (strain JEL478) TaxID=1344416 RepID=A0A139AKP4_GONPJ|nr:hypothetical protein M427DRAFT_133476 [Gonapodya prolifera JEL478]|eukprot:KXS17340.1 hypothetical protein M427DRAFT_133476 [Gonapodya prolifera JEL478]